MLNIVLCIRKPGKLEIEDSMSFSVPELPRVGDYISVGQLDLRDPLSCDYIVRTVWWRLRRSNDPEGVGSLTEIIVEADIASGPYSSREWKQNIAFERSRGIHIDDFDAVRITVGLGNDLSDDEA